MSKGSKQRPTDRKKLEQNWPWPDPFEQRLAMKREEEQKKMKKDGKSVDTDADGGNLALSRQ